ncbi:phage tail protein [Undibacterium squillarum]|jgi:microcystin-dependent protein|uniref:phage tail protein n=1 Tax=Undibacterium squillarum TaxID=1131567 RepID=UPI0035AF9BA9
MAEPFIGEIRIFGGNYAPEGWLLCNGQSLSIAENQALFSLIATTYGGDGVNTFNIPDLRGRLPIGMGSGTGLTPRTIGQVVGAETVTLTNANMPAHNHTINGTTNAATATTLSPNSTYGVTTNTFYFVPDAAITESPFAGTLLSTANGGNLPHENRMPSIALSYIIATTGIFPTRP